MAENSLKMYVLARADEDDSLSEDARMVVLAALDSPAELAEALGGNSDSQYRPAKASGTEADSTPVGAYLASITVQGFRGIGPQVSLNLQPGPGLIVIAGRNGSGKSTLAEALEIALTGRNSRWDNKAGVWSQAWRNLHAGDPVEIRIGITEENSGTTTVGVDWPSGEAELGSLRTWVQRAGQKREDIDVLGWKSALEMYRPLLSYDELGHILEGSPSQFYDQLHRLLGLEQLAEAVERIDAEIKRLRKPAAEVKAARDELKAILEAHADPRAPVALAQVKKSKPDVRVVWPLITEGVGVASAEAWQQAERLAAPAAEEARVKISSLREAAVVEQQELKNTDALAADRVKLIEQGLQFHDQHGDQPCPMCSIGMLDGQWSNDARATLVRERDTAQALTAAREATAQARSALVHIIRGVARPSISDDDLTTLLAARQSYERFAAVPLGDDMALAEHVEATLPDLEACYGALRQEAATLIQQRADQWEPAAVKLAAWIGLVQGAADVERPLQLATQALKWLQTNAGELRNERIAPLADQAKRIWAMLRQESNVDLGAIRLEGQRTSRRVALRAEVDGAETEAFGVMSQGELQALALAIFIPRATSPESPFRFVVLDDPIQAMDPSKIDGFLEVLTELALERQVIVLTHDDRLPSAIRATRTQARIIEVTRGTNSIVHVAESSDPASRLLADAFAIAADEAVPSDIKRLAVPRLCREAVEVAAKDVFSSRALAQGLSRSDIETRWEDAPKVAKRLALALSLDADDNAAVDKWLAGGPARKATMNVVNKGIHQGIFNFKAAVNDARRCISDLTGIPK